MNLVLTHCWREWRAQRLLLAGFLAVSIAGLCLLFAQLPDAWWLTEGHAAEALAWFVVAGGVGALGFAAPALVRREHGSKGDQFVRRLPGALWPSFAGKLLFLALVSVALPLLGLVAAELFLLANGRGWADLYRSLYDGSVEIRWPWPLVWLGFAGLLVPWVWAIGTWLPAGRMAVGGAILLALVVGVGVGSVLQVHGGIENGIAWRWWLPYVPLLGVVVAGTSWVFGRRGGGAVRSAWVGGLTTLVGLLPPAAWFGVQCWRYFHPDPQQLQRLQVYGLNPDLRYAVVTGNGHEDFQWGVPFRVDLRDGTAVQLSTTPGTLTTESRQPAESIFGVARYWGDYDYDIWRDRPRGYRLLDLETLATVARAEFCTIADAPAQLDALRAGLPDGGAAASSLLAPGGVRVWFDGAELCFQVEAGRVDRMRWMGAVPRSVRPCGHGFRAYGRDGNSLFDLTTRIRMPDAHGSLWLVRGVQISRDKTAWLRRRDAASEPMVVPELAGAEILGLLDDDHLLCERSDRSGRQSATLFAWNAATDQVLPIERSTQEMWTAVSAREPLHLRGSVLKRDPAGFVWLSVRPVGRSESQCFVRLDPATRRCEVVPGELPFRCMTLLAWPDAASALLHVDNTIQRLDAHSGERAQLFPRR